jgi:predicted dehydrogenase
MTRRIILVGYGHVGQEKFTPALMALAQTSVFQQFSNGETAEFWILDTNQQKQATIAQLQDQIPVQSNIVVRSLIQDLNMLDDMADTLEDGSFDLAYIASPNDTHAPYMAFFLRYANLVLVEKPLVDYLSDLSDLEAQFTPAKLDAIRLVDHYLFKDAILHFFNNSQQYMRKIGTVRQLTFSLIEEAPIRPGRRWLYQTGMIRDLAVHGLSILFKLSEYDILPLTLVNLTLVKCQKAWYDAVPKDIQNPRETAAHLQYQIGELPFSITVGKGAGFTQKQFQLIGDTGTLLINTVTNTIALKQDDVVDILYTAESAVQPYPEYFNLLNGFFKVPSQVGLSYQSAKTQIRLVEATDAVKTGMQYKRGTFPFPPPSLNP